MNNQVKSWPFKRAMALAVAFLILSTPSVSLGWGAAGHMMVASIAFKRLNPRARAKAMELLAIPITPASVTNQSKDFINASHWADDLRPFAEFDSFKELHFIDTPFTTDGTPLPEVPTPNVVTALEDNVRILKTSRDENEQAQALRFIIHFVGDIHDPLHCATKVDSAHPDGDRGGNLMKIKIASKEGKPKATNLHSYWDGGLGSFPATGPNFRPPLLSEITPAAAKAMTGNPATNPKLQLDDPFDFQSWADESFKVARDVAYEGIKNDAKPTATYQKKALKVANQRVAWAGYRLAALLNVIWPD